jgi:hypothetical protein
MKPLPNPIKKRPDHGLTDKNKTRTLAGGARVRVLFLSVRKQEIDKQSPVQFWIVG